MDRLSDMPKNILHDILSRLPEEDVARTSVLSKTWNKIWSTFPILNFSDISRGILLRYHHPGMEQEYMAKLGDFLTSVDTTLLRFHDSDLAIKEFKLSMRSFNPDSMSTRIDNWIKIASESSVKVLKLLLRHDLDFVGLGPVDTWYKLPLSILEAKSVTKLELKGAIRVDQAFLNNEIKFPTLQMLSLNVYFGKEEALRNLISGCPLVENLTLTSCGGLEVARIHGLPKLKVAKFILSQEVDLDTPSVECLEFGFHDESHPIFPCKINMDKCSSLKELIFGYMHATLVTRQWLVELFNKFPLLEKLEFHGHIMSERIKISGAWLKVLNIDACSDSELKEAEIDAPNLESFRYFGYESEMPAISFVNTSNHLMDVNVRFIIRSHMDFEGLRNFIQSIPKNVLASVTLRILLGTDFNLGALQDMSLSSPRIKRLTLSVNALKREELCLRLVTGLFWSIRPAIVSLVLVWCTKNFIEVLCEKLTCKREEEGTNSSGEIKCWWHNLKDVKVTSSSKKFENVTDCQSLLDSLPRRLSTLSPEDEISFMLEWDSSE